MNGWMDGWMGGQMNGSIGDEEINKYKLMNERINVKLIDITIKNI